jgi:hypothetical protein
MSEQHSEKEMQKALFLNLVMMFSSAAMQQMGKLVNPATGKTEMNMEAAQFNIDLIEMLKAKATGNMDHDEETFLTNSLTSLQMTYVETANTQPAAQAPAEGADRIVTPAEDGATPPPSGSEKDPKYHKSYG